jgi:hypothetical protein
MICCGIVYATARVANIRSKVKCVETRRNGSDTRRNEESPRIPYEFLTESVGQRYWNVPIR